MQFIFLQSWYEDLCVMWDATQYSNCNKLQFQYEYLKIINY